MYCRVFSKCYIIKNSYLVPWALVRGNRMVCIRVYRFHIWCGTELALSLRLRRISLMEHKHVSGQERNVNEKLTLKISVGIQP